MTPIPSSNKSFQQIIKFYLFECPVRTRERVPQKERINPQDKYKFRFKKVSKRGKSFDERGLDGSNLNTLRAAMKRVADVTMQAVEGDVVAPETKEFIVIKKNEDNTSVTEGYFYCIRNAFAHGDFDIEKGVYELRNRSGDKTKGLARLNEKTLLKWIELVDLKPEELKQIGR